MDVAVLLWAAAFAFLFRLGFDHQFNASQVIMILSAPVTAIPLFAQFGLYRAVLRYLPERALVSMFKSVLMATLLWTALAFFSGSYGGGGVPRSVPFLYAIFAFLSVSVSRFTAKWILVNSIVKADLRRTLVYGAGHAGTQLALSLRDGGQANILGFVDDDPELEGRDVAGMRVYAPGQLERLVENLGIEEIILGIPSAPSAKKLKIATLLSTLPVTVRVLPARLGPLGEAFDIKSLERVDISELIGRSPVPPDESLIENVIRGKRILITGAGGSIGTQLARLVDTHAPREVFLVDNNEFALYRVARSLTNARQFYPAHAVLGSITNEKFVRRILEHNRVDVVFHAAAFKHVDMVEQNVREGICNNIFGTEVMARTSFEAGVKQFVLISSDKAVNPTSVMGATKRIGELVLRKYAELAAERGTGQDFLAVRFGNVVGSSGSVVPLFRRQIENGGPITVTDRHVTRYFMAASEAVELIVQSAALSKGGETFILDMGDPISIYELARDMVAISGLQVKDEYNPGGDIEIEFIGLRPGEKLHEELWYSADATIRTAHPKIMMVKLRTDAHLKIDGILAKLRDAVDSLEETDLRNQLMALTRDFNRDQFAPQVIPLHPVQKAKAV